MRRLSIRNGHFCGIGMRQWSVKASDESIAGEEVTRARHDESVFRHGGQYGQSALTQTRLSTQMG